MADRLQIRRDTAANWTSANPILAQGEWGYELDENRLKIGDGILDWVNLPYFAGGGGGYVMKEMFNYSGSNIFTLSQTPSDVILADLKGQVTDGVSGLAWTLSGNDITVIYDLQVGDSIQIIYTVGSIGGSAVTTAQSTSIAQSVVSAQKDQEGGIAANDTSILSLDTVAELSTAPRINRTRAYVNGGGQGGNTFTYIPVGSGLVANGGTIYNAADGGLWKRDFDGGISSSWFGTTGDGVTNDTSALISAISALPPGSTLYIPIGNYIVSSEILINKEIKLEMADGARILFDAATAGVGKACFLFQGTSGVTSNLSVNASLFSRDISVVDSTGFAVGDWVYIEATDMSSPNARVYDTKRGFHRISAIVGNVISLYSPLLFDYETANTAKITKINMLDKISVSGGHIEATSLADSSYGIKLDKCSNFNIVGCNISEFDYACIDVSNSVLGSVSNNSLKISYSDDLQYGITVFSSFHISVMGNNCDCQRTGIDVTRLSRFVNVVGNVLYNGRLNTHTCYDVNFISNTVFGSGMLIRGINITVSNNIIKSYENPGCLDIQEAGLDGPNYFYNNSFEGYFSAKLIGNGSKFEGNTVRAFSYLTYDTTKSSLIRIQSSATDRGLSIKNNSLLYEGSDPQPLYNIDVLFGTLSIVDYDISGNILKGGNQALQASCLAANVDNKNLSITNNTITAGTKGILYRLVDSTTITGNRITALNQLVPLTHGIQRQSVSTVPNDRTGLVISNNIIEYADLGIDSSAGNSKVYEVILQNNAMYNVTTRENTTNFIFSLDNQKKYSAAVMARKTANQSIPNATDTAVVWDAVLYDEFAIWDSGSGFIVPSWATKARVSVKVEFDANATGVIRSSRTQVNGLDVTGMGFMNLIPSTGRNVVNYESAIFIVTPGNVITNVVHQDSGGALNLLTGTGNRNCHIQIELYK